MTFKALTATIDAALAAQDTAKTQAEFDAACAISAAACAKRKALFPAAHAADDAAICAADAGAAPWSARTAPDA